MLKRLQILKCCKWKIKEFPSSLLWTICKIYSEKKLTTFAFRHFSTISGQLHKYLSQNLDSNGHFEGLNIRKSQLDQILWHKSQFFLTSVFSILEERKWKLKFQKWPFFDHLWSFLWQLHRYISQNWDSNSALFI